ncbi:acyltransferase [Paenibacillus contaminans]|uniref:Acyltransferase n=1 Tax=Paenibacillus contaminans TaxID=450362 RepID=A0A329MQL1_9BACL|nr:acyltransferase [Paenibacillus contaminans]RAV22064.1 acyltransferase [Paenibacillus contaminans]
MNNFYTHTELHELGLAGFGKNVLISRKTSIYGAKDMLIGDDVRIDDFCILSGKINIGNYIHIGTYTALYGGDKGIVIEDFANISSRVSIYSIGDDFSGETMTNPTIPENYKQVTRERVIIQKHVMIGCGSVVLPGTTLKEGSAFGALSLVNKDPNEWSINVGIPFREIKKRSRNVLELERKFKEERDYRE